MGEDEEKRIRWKGVEEMKKKKNGRNGKWEGKKEENKVNVENKRKG